MSREGILQELSAYSVSVQELKYSAAHVSVYRGLFASTVAAVKVLPWQEGTDYTGLEKECSTMLALTHPNILKLLSCFWVQREGKSHYVIVTEWCEKDLEKDIQQRAQHTFPFTEKDLLAICCQTIDALAFMQAQGLAHRDLKPQNIFLTSSKSVKIGDFGSAAGTSYEFGDIVGTPYYLSPILKEALATSQVQVQHDPFKSDVYSLGLTILGAAKLGVSVKLMRPVKDEEMGEEIASIPFSEEVKTLLKAMLGREESNRWNFLQLREWASTRPWGTEYFSSLEHTLIQRFSPIPAGPDQTTQVHRYSQQTGDTDKVQPASEPDYSPSRLSTHFPSPQQESLGRYQPPALQEIPAVVPSYPPPQVFPVSPPVTPIPHPYAIPSYEGSETPYQPPQAVETEHHGYSYQAAVETAVHPTESSGLGSCMQCGRVVTEGDGSLVQLLCRPDHMYCSHFCFLKSVNSRSSRCPSCGQEIHPHLLRSLREVSSQFPTCLVCAQRIDLPNPTVRAALPRPVCRTHPEHICCSEQCSEQLKGICPLCSIPIERNPVQAPLLQERAPSRSWLVRFLMCQWE